MAATFGKRKFFSRIEQSIFLTYPVGQKFRRNSSISHGLGDTAILSFTIFVKNSKIQNGCHFWKEENFFGKMCRVSCLDTLWAKNFAEIIICELFVMNTT